MQYLRRQTISFFSVFLCSVLGALLILGEPAFAEDLLPHKAYKVSRVDTELTDACYGQTAYVKFKFNSSPFSEDPDKFFEDIYPIQDGWELLFNTPIDSGVGVFTDLGLDDGLVTSCSLDLTESTLTDDGLGEEPFKLDLLSGFKTKEDASENKTGHFVVGKDYYVYDENKEADDEEAYTFLGSLTAIGGDNFPALNGASVGELVIAPNSIRAPHWHLNYAEVAYCYEGLGQVGTIAPSFAIAGDEDFSEHPRIEEMFINPGEVFIFPLGSQHYLRNISSDENFSCVLFFAQGTPINPGQLLTITLQEVSKNTPLGTLQPVFSMDRDTSGSLKYTAEQLSQSPDQSYIPTAQGPEPLKVVEVCRGRTPNINDPGCPSYSDKHIEERGGKTFDRSIFSRLQP